MFKAVKRFSERFYRWVNPDRYTIDGERLKALYRAEEFYNNVMETALAPAKTPQISKRVLSAVRHYTAEEYETYKHNPSFMEFVKEDLIRSFLPEISKRVEIRTDYNPCYKTARIEGRFTFWEEIK